MTKLKKLTKAEHLEMELNQEQLNNVKLEKMLQVEKKQSKLLKMKITELESRQQLQIMDNKLTTIDSKIALLEKEIKTFNQKMKDKYKIKGGFAINSDSGEIIEE